MEKFYILAPIDEITEDMIRDDLRDKLGRIPTQSETLNAHKLMRTVKDTSINPPMVFGILKFNSRFTTSTVGHKKYTNAELKEELKGVEWEHNQGV